MTRFSSPKVYLRVLKTMSGPVSTFHRCTVFRSTSVFPRRSGESSVNSLIENLSHNPKK